MIFLDTPTDSGYLIIYIAGVLISLFIFGAVIATAMRVNRRERHNRIIIKLLSAIAEKNGVDQDKLVELIKEAEK